MKTPLQTTRGNGARRLACWLAVLAAFASFSPAHAALTAAGTTITNTATATYTSSGGQSVSLDSNPVVIKVDEILNVNVAAADPSDVATTAGATNQVMSFTVTNTGNGTQAMKLTPVSAIAGDQFDPTVTAIYLDTNHDNVYDAGDTLYTAGSNDPVLLQDGSIKVFVLSTIPSAVVNGNLGQLNLTAQDVAAGSSTTPGTVLTGKGAGGVDAVIGASGATSTDHNFYLVQQADVTFVKSAVILDPFGGTTPVPGATITYTLLATVNGTGSLTGLVMTDAFPANTTYVPGSMTLQAGVLTDVADVDAGTASATGISVALPGAVAAGQTRTVTFQVKIN